jgi:hypothetical protein
MRSVNLGVSKQNFIKKINKYVMSMKKDDVGYKQLRNSKFLLYLIQLNTNFNKGGKFVDSRSIQYFYKAFENPESFQNLNLNHLVIFTSITLPILTDFRLN